MKYRCVRSYAGQYRAGMGDILDEIPPGISPLFFEVVEESAMLPPPKPKKTGQGLKPVTFLQGVGGKTAEALAGIGVSTIAQLAAASLFEVSDLPGFSEAKAKWLIMSAREVLT